MFNIVECTRFYILRHYLMFPDFDFGDDSQDEEHNDLLQSSY